jgi:hypothetical protein
LLLQVCLSVLYNDNQANGLLALRLLVDLVKHLVRNQLAAYEAQIGETLTYMHKVGGGGCLNVRNMAALFAPLTHQLPQVTPRPQPDLLSYALPPPPSFGAPFLLAGVQ